MATLTKQGRNLLRWLKHFKIASQIADAKMKGALTPEAKEDEARALKLFARMVRAKYQKRGI